MAALRSEDILLDQEAVARALKAPRLPSVDESRPAPRPRLPPEVERESNRSLAIGLALLLFAAMAAIVALTPP